MEKFFMRDTVEQELTAPAENIHANPYIPVRKRLFCVVRQLRGHTWHAAEKFCGGACQTGCIYDNVYGKVDYPFV